MTLLGVFGRKQETAIEIPTAQPKLDPAHEEALVEALLTINQGWLLIAITDSEARFEAPLRGRKRARKSTYTIISVPNEAAREQIVLTAYLSMRIDDIVWALNGTTLWCIRDAKFAVKWELYGNHSVEPIDANTERQFAVAVSGDYYENFLVSIGIKKENGSDETR